MPKLDILKDLLRGVRTKTIKEASFSENTKIQGAGILRLNGAIMDFLDDKPATLERLAKDGP